MSPPGAVLHGLGGQGYGGPLAVLRSVQAQLEAVRQALNGLQATLDSLDAQFAAQDLKATARQPPAGQNEAVGSKWLTITQAAREFGLTRKWFLVHWREIPGAGKAGKKLVLFQRAALERWIMGGRIR